MHLSSSKSSSSSSSSIYHHRWDGRSWAIANLTRPYKSTLWCRMHTGTIRSISNNTHCINVYTFTAHNMQSPPLPVSHNLQSMQKIHQKIKISKNTLIVAERNAASICELWFCWFGLSKKWLAGHCYAPANSTADVSCMLCFFCTISNIRSRGLSGQCRIDIIKAFYIGWFIKFDNIYRVEGHRIQSSVFKMDSKTEKISSNN